MEVAAAQIGPQLSKFRRLYLEPEPVDRLGERSIANETIGPAETPLPVNPKAKPRGQLARPMRSLGEFRG